MEKSLAHATDRDFVFFHLWGQHLWAGSRFPHTPENLYFTADSIIRPDLAEKYRAEIADYDNATRYNVSDRSTPYCCQ